jgi:transcriptional regulator with PAS, ATPase and Fis domain
MQPDYLQALKLHTWPGNIRELKNVIERSVILETSDMLTVNAPADIVNEAVTTGNNQDKTLSAFSLAASEKVQIQKVLNYTNGNKAEAARLLGIGIATLYRKIEEYKIA